MLILNVIQGPDKGRRFELPDTEPQLIGRSSESLPLQDVTISRRHAELTPDDGQWLIRDLDSANGTYVNGKKIIGATILNAGDQLRAGNTLFVFGRSAAQPSRPPIYATDNIESNVEASVASNEESLIMAIPEPGEAAQVHLKVLYDLMQLVGTIFDKPVLLERVMDLIFDHFEPDRGFILLRDEMAEDVSPAVVRYRYQPRNTDDTHFAVSRTIVHHVLFKSEGILSSNAMTDKRFAEGESVQAYGIRSAICVPIKFHDKVSGVIYTDSKVANYTFTEDQLRLLTAIGAQTGMALENAELYRKGLAGARLAAVGETVASLSHSVRNIMQAIRGGQELVELGLRKSQIDVVRNGWSVLSRNLERVYQLTMNMLTFSKQRVPEMEPSSIPKLVEEVGELMRPQCVKSGVTLNLQIDRNMPPIPADTASLHQALLNLLVNAVESIDKPDGGQVTLACRFDPRKNEALLAIADNGAGIDTDSRKQLFRPFYSTKGLRGTGLGLAVTKKVVDEHHGTIEVKSTPGKGTVFTIHIPGQHAGDPGATH